MRTRFSLLLILSLLIVQTSISFAQDDVVTIEFWHTYNETSPENEMLVETLIPAFEEAHPNIQVESVPFPYDEFRQTILTAVAGGEGPDVARLDIIWSPEFAAQGVLVALDEAMEDFDSLAERTFPGPLSTNRYDGNYYGLPLDTNTRVYVYNQYLYEDLGIDGPPATIDELTAQCDLLQDGQYLFSDGGTYGWAMLPWIWTFGGSITDADITTATGYLNSPETVAAYEYLRDMVQNGCFSDGFIGSGIDTGAGYYTNSIVSMLEGPWMFPIGAAQYPDFEMKAALMPAGPGGSVSVVGGENIALFTTSEHQEAAMEFIRFTQSDEYQLKMSETGQLTVIPELLENEYFQNHPYYGIFLEQLETAQARTPHPAWNTIEEILTEVGYSIVAGEMEAQEALDIAAAQIDELLMQ